VCANCIYFVSEIKLKMSGEKISIIDLDMYLQEKDLINNNYSDTDTLVYFFKLDEEIEDDPIQVNLKVLQIVEKYKKINLLTDEEYDYLKDFVPHICYKDARKEYLNLILGKLKDEFGGKSLYYTCFKKLLASFLKVSYSIEEISEYISKVFPPFVAFQFTKILSSCEVDKQVRDSFKNIEKDMGKTQNKLIEKWKGKILF